jgi:O-antigen/teichoic acid export membrane protein
MLSLSPLTDNSSLKRRVFNAGAWSMAGYGLGLATRFASNLLMTRLLVPEMFGVMAIANIIMIALEMFSDLGLRQCIVQSRRGDDPKFLNTAWLVQIGRGVMLWAAGIAVALLALLANFLGLAPQNSVYADPNLPGVIAVLSFAAIIFGFGTTKMFEASRKLVFGRVAIIGAAAQIVGLLSMLTWAYFDRSIWALVAGNVCGSLATIVFGHIFLPGTPNRWQWDSSAFQDILGFGKWIFLSSIFGFLAANCDRILLGSLIDSTMLGLYVLAFQIVSMVEHVLIKLIGGVSYPAFSEIARERLPSLRSAYYKVHAVVASIAYLSSGLLTVSGQQLIAFLYDQRYSQAGWMLELLSFMLLAIPLQISIQCFMALGRPQLHSQVLLIRLITLLLAVPGGFQLLGLQGAVLGVVSSQFICLPIIIYYSARHRLFDLRRELMLLPLVAVGMCGGLLIGQMLQWGSAVR